MSASGDISNFLKGLAAARDRAIAAARRAVDRAGEMVVGNAQQLTPIDTGALKASGTTEPAEVRGTSISKVIGFNTDYAAAVHERLDLDHSGVTIKVTRDKKGRRRIIKKQRSGQAKFLEAAMKEFEPRFAEYVAEQVRAALGGGA